MNTKIYKSLSYCLMSRSFLLSFITFENKRFGDKRMKLWKNSPIKLEKITFPCSIRI